MDQIDVLKVEGDSVGLAYLYSKIVRKIIFFPIANVTLNTTEIEYYEDLRLRNNRLSDEAQQSYQF